MKFIATDFLSISYPTLVINAKGSAIGAVEETR
jgi:hypothetical protein